MPPVTFLIVHPSSLQQSNPSHSSATSNLVTCLDYPKIDKFDETLLNIKQLWIMKVLEQNTYSYLALAYAHFSDYKNAVVYYNLLLTVAESLEDKREEGIAYAGLGNTWFRLGDFRKSLDYYKCALSNAEDLTDKLKIAIAYGGLGNASQALGHTETAISYLELSLDYAKDIGNKIEMGKTYSTLGYIFNSLGDFKKSIEYHNRHLDIAKEVGDVVGQSEAYGGLGNAFDSLGDFEKAIGYHGQQLGIAKKAGDKVGEAVANANLGNAYFSLNNFKKALHHYEQHLRIALELGDKAGEGGAYLHLGEICETFNNYTKAKNYYNRCLLIAEDLGDKARTGYACGGLGGVFLHFGNWEKAEEFYEKKLRIFEELGNKRHVALAHHGLGQCFELMGRLPIAVENYQSSVNVLNEIRLLQSEDQWKIGFRNEYNIAYIRLWGCLLKQEKIGEALAAAEEGRAQSLADLMTSQYGFQSQTEGKRLDEEEFGMLNNTTSSTIFLSLSENKINIWLLLKEKPVLHRQTTLCHYFAENAAAETLQSLIQFAYKNNDVRANVNCENRSLDVLRENCFTVKRSSKKFSHQILQEDNPPLAALYSYVIAPILDLIEGDELIIVPDGPLWLAPFAALLNPFSKYLCESFKVRLIPSLTSLKIIAHCPEFHSSSGALVVGDPDMSEVTNSLGDPILEQLRFARQEAQMIGQILNTAPLTGKLATKCEVLKQISSVAVIHIAAHGCMETGEIALSPNPKRRSQIPAEEDYILTMSDVMSVKLRAKLVVLSCCYSGRGEIKAEGVVGIARVFMGAGARSVLVTLWAIDDEATLEFMKNFYHNLVEGRSASESVNHAMKFLKESEKFSDVKYWAPFTLIGDDVTLSTNNKKSDAPRETQETDR